MGAGYADWAASYDDEPDNDTVALEEPLVQGILDGLSPGRALDAGCGTGRHAAHLAALGHEVVGVDASEPMLAVRPGGRLIVSNPHPLATAILGRRCVVRDPATGVRTTVREHPHTHGDYLGAFAAAGLVAHRCLEPGLTPQQARARGKGLHPELHEAALTGLPAVIVWEAERQG